MSNFTNLKSTYMEYPKVVKSLMAAMKAEWAEETTSFPNKQEAAIGPALQNIIPNPF